MDEPRNQFTFYRSYFDAIAALPKKEQAAIILAVCDYALYEREPEKLSPVGKTCFALIRPTLDSGRKKAASGKQGGKTPKQSASKPEAKGKQSAREKEREREKEKEVERENECKGFAAEANFEEFFSAYPRKSYEDEAREAWAALDPDDLPAVMASLDRWKTSEEWTADGGRYIPCAAKWLGKGLWRDTPPSAAALKQRELSADELEAIRRMAAEDEPDILWAGRG